MSECLDKLLPALAQAQAAYPKIGAEKTGQVQNRTYKYLDMVGIMEAVRKPNTEAGLIVVHLSDTEYTETRVIHVASGQYLAARLRIDPQLSEQSLGKALTYGRRYCISGLLGICPDEDSDAQEAENEQQTRRSTRASMGITEGTVKKGGQNPPPTTARPSDPKGQQPAGGAPEKTSRAATGVDFDAPPKDDGRVFWAKCYSMAETGSREDVTKTVRAMCEAWKIESTTQLSPVQKLSVWARLEELYAPPPPSDSDA